jgi:hypothetical protein
VTRCLPRTPRTTRCGAAETAAAATPAPTSSGASSCAPATNYERSRDAAAIRRRATEGEDEMKPTPTTGRFKSPELQEAYEAGLTRSTTTIPSCCLTASAGCSTKPTRPPPAQSGWPRCSRGR